jgi:dipeptidyl aminopeptidase/acylaminoacyl peptidase
MKLRVASLFLLLCFYSVGAIAAADHKSTVDSTSARNVPPPSRHFLQPMDIFLLEFAEDPQISPDGRTLAYTRVTIDIKTDRMRRSIWLVDTASGKQRPLLSAGGQCSDPSWLPDGTRLAYWENVDGKGQYSIYSLRDQSTKHVPGLPDSASSINWSPDGRSIAFSMFVPDPATPPIGGTLPKPEGADWGPPLEQASAFGSFSPAKPGHAEIFLMPAEGGTPRQLTHGKLDLSGAKWSPDERYLFLSATPDERVQEEQDVYRVTVADGTITDLTNRYGADRNPLVSPDGSKIAYFGYEQRGLVFHHAHLYVMDLKSGTARSLTSGFDQDIRGFKWAADSKRLYIHYNERALAKIASLTLDGKISELTDELGVWGFDDPWSAGYWSVADNGVLAFTNGSPVHPSDVSILRKGKVRRLVVLNDWLQNRTIGKIRYLPVSGRNGRKVDAWLVTPPDFDPGRKYPLIVKIHGGPHSSYGPFFSLRLQLWAAAGYVVLYPNQSGSTSYGEAFANLVEHNVAEPQYEDVMSAVDAAVATGFVDPDNLFITGSSNGGLVSAWAIGKTNRFRAAVIQSTIINFTSSSLTSGSYTWYPRLYMGKMPWEDPQYYWQQSPLSLVGNVSTPTLLFTGTEDGTVPPTEVEQFYAALQLRNVPTMLLKGPGMGHDWDFGSFRGSQYAALINATTAWFDRYRKK